MQKLIKIFWLFLITNFNLFEEINITFAATKKIFNLIMAIETPDYNLLDSQGRFELREYKSFLVAKTTVENDYKEATIAGFRKVANYIFGGNESQLSIAMTAPVIANVPNDKGIYDIVFVMPKKHTLSSLPTPNDNQVKIEIHNLGKTAVVKFGGWATKSRTKYYKKQLEKYLRNNAYIGKGDFLVAQYNSPWALPPFRRNEVLISIE